MRGHKHILPHFKASQAGKAWEWEPLIYGEYTKSNQAIFLILDVVLYF